MCAAQAKGTAKVVKEKKPKKEKAAAPAEVAAVPAPAPAPAPPRPPADPRLKVWKKFQGRFLPKGTLRDRLNAITATWNATEDHTGVTVDQLKSLHNDWKASWEPGKKPKKTAVKV
jgi:hypothetical protein